MGICILLLKIKCVWLIHVYIRGFPGGTRGKESSCQCRRHKETWVWSLGREDLLEKEVTTHSSIPAWRIPWTEEPGGLQFMGSQRVGHDWSDWVSKYIHSDPIYFNCYTELHYRNKLQSIFFFFYNLFSMLLSKSIWIRSNNDAANLHIPVLFCTFGRIYQGH